MRTRFVLMSGSVQTYSASARSLSDVKAESISSVLRRRRGRSRRGRDRPDQPERRRTDASGPPSGTARRRRSQWPSDHAAVVCTRAADAARPFLPIRLAVACTRFTISSARTSLFIRWSRLCRVNLAAPAAANSRVSAICATATGEAEEDYDADYWPFGCP